MPPVSGLNAASATFSPALNTAIASASYQRASIPKCLVHHHEVGGIALPCECLEPSIFVEGTLAQGRVLDSAAHDRRRATLLKMSARAGALRATLAECCLTARKKPKIAASRSSTQFGCGHKERVAAQTAPKGAAAAGSAASRRTENVKKKMEAVLRKRERARDAASVQQAAPAPTAAPSKTFSREGKRSYEREGGIEDARCSYNEYLLEACVTLKHMLPGACVTGMCTLLGCTRWDLYERVVTQEGESVMDKLDAAREFGSSDRAERRLRPIAELRAVAGDAPGVAGGL